MHQTTSKRFAKIELNAPHYEFSGTWQEFFDATPTRAAIIREGGVYALVCENCPPPTCTLEELPPQVESEE